MTLAEREMLNILVFDDGNIPALSPAIRCVVQLSPDKIEEYTRKFIVDAIFVGRTETHPSVSSNVFAISKQCSSLLIIAMVHDYADAEAAFANGAADCMFRSQFTADMTEQRVSFARARARYLKLGGENQLYTHNDLAAIARILSHDIRNALSGIVLSIDPIRSACGHDSEGKSYVDILDRSSTKLTQVINQFSLAAGNIALKPKNENLVDILRHSIATFPEIAGRDMKIIEEYGQSEIMYPIDRDKFPLAIVNLLSNAADAAEGKSHARVRVKAEVVDRDIYLRIEDNGHGIDFTTLQNVFRPFFTTRPGKSGLGLPLAKSIISAHGGHLRIESSTGGTAIICRFPLIR